MTIDETVAHVTELPDCDIHTQVFGAAGIPAAYDAATNSGTGAWAYMCTDCWPKWSTGQLGLGKGQRLEVTA